MCRKPPYYLLPFLSVIWILYGCAAVGLTLLGVGAGIGGAKSVDHTLGGISYRTFSNPLPEVEEATLSALDYLEIKVVKRVDTRKGKFIGARGSDRDIEISLERISAKSTRVRTVVKRGFFLKDRATATELISQTKQFLELPQYMDTQVARSRGFGADAVVESVVPPTFGESVLASASGGPTGVPMRLGSWTVRIIRLQYPFMQGKDVRATQEALREEGIAVEVDGVFGYDTEAAVIEYQRQKGLVADGVVGPATRSHLGL
ncbi:MAG: peptidoglycan-binding protein [Nitrospinota bacterium]